MMETDESTHIPRVNGHMLSNYLRRQVLLNAELITIENLKMKIKCCDGPIIMADLHEPIGQHLAPNTKIQVLATPKSKNVIQCNDFIVLSDNNNDFDVELYNETVKMLAEQEDSNTYLIKNVAEHWGATNEKEVDLIDAPESGKQNGNANGESHSQNLQSKNESFF